MGRLMSAFCFSVFCVSLLLIPKSCHGKPVLALFLFGDSLYDAGNNNYIPNAGKANFWPYGKTFFKHPTGRFSDGRIIPDFIAEYAKLPLIPPYLQPGNHQFTYGVNFASGGAGALSETLPPGTVIDLKTQLRYFKNVESQLREKQGYAETKKLLSKSLYLFSIGSNDYLAPFFATNTSLTRFYSRNEYVGMVIGNLTTVIKEVYKSGGRKFGFLKLGSVGCLPVVRAFNPNGTGGCIDEINVLPKLHNLALTKVLKDLHGELQGFQYSVFDLYTSFKERFYHPSKYGFKEAEVACCGSGPYRGTNCGGTGATKEYHLCEHPSEYLFFDGGHPSEKVNNQYAKLMWSGSPDVSGPYNLKTLLQM